VADECALVVTVSADGSAGVVVKLRQQKELVACSFLSCELLQSAVTSGAPSSQNGKSQ
jgi:hypothetical protein